MKKNNQAFTNYEQISEKINKNKIYLLSGRYKFTSKKYNEIIKDIILKLQPSKNEILLDIGTGDGTLTKKLSRKFKTVYTIDSHKIIKKLNEFRVFKGIKNIKFLRGNFLFKNFKFKIKFDKILIYSVVQYLNSYKDFIKFLDKSLKNLNKGGILLVGDIPNKDMNDRYKKTKEFKKLSIIFKKKTKIQFSRIDKQFHDMFTKSNYIKFNDNILLKVLKKYNNKIFESYVLPQKKKLPYSVNRVDLMILKR